MRASKGLLSLVSSIGLSIIWLLSFSVNTQARHGLSNIRPHAPRQITRRHTPTGNLSGERNTARAGKRLRAPDVMYYPTPPTVVAEMLRLAHLKSDDVLYDLGSGDGRIPIMAARQYGIRAVGIDINPRMTWVAAESARATEVANRVRFINADIFQAKISEATVITLYLSRTLNMRLRPKLLRELRPGTRIISHDYDMGNWKPEQIVKVPWHNLYRTIYVWTVPPKKSKNKY